MDASRQICLRSTPCPRPPRAQRILDTAFRLFYARGIRAVGVDPIIAESGVAKATFYKHFPAKDDLVVAYLDRVDDVWSGQLHAAAEAAGPEPADQLVGLFDALGIGLPPGGLPRLRLHQRRRRGGAGDARARAHGRPQARRSWPGCVSLAAEAGAADPDGLARSLTLLLDGGLASGALDADPEVAVRAKQSAKALVRLAVPG